MALMTKKFNDILDQVNNAKARDLLTLNKYKNIMIAAEFALDLENAMKPTVKRFSDMLEGLREQNRELLEEKEILNEKLTEQSKMIAELEDIKDEFG